MCYYLNVHFQGQRVKSMKFYERAFYGTRRFFKIKLTEQNIAFRIILTVSDHSISHLEMFTLFTSLIIPELE